MTDPITSNTYILLVIFMNQNDTMMISLIQNNNISVSYYYMFILGSVLNLNAFIGTWYNLTPGPSVCPSVSTRFSLFTHLLRKYKILFYERMFIMNYI